MEKQYTQQQLLKMMRDANPYTRVEAARHIDESYLPILAKDKYDYVRQAAAKRIDVSYLPNMINDSDWHVRFVVAQRIDESYLPGMLIKETDYSVIQAIMKRLM